MRIAKLGRSAATTLAAAIVLTGCYHAVIDTGLAPGNQTVEKQWAHGFLYGLVPPSTVETAAKCPHGAARVETQQSFVNEVANLLTFGIYTPMQINVTCAATGAMAEVTPSVSGTDAEVVLAKAIQKSFQTGDAVVAQVVR